MAKKKLNKREAILYCLSLINRDNPEFSGPVKSDQFKEYDKLRKYKTRYEAGTLKEKAIQTLFDRFGIKEHCYFTVSKDN